MDKKNSTRQKGAPGPGFRPLGALLCCLLWMAACTPPAELEGEEQSTEAQLQDADRVDGWEKEIAAAEERWLAAGVTSYEIEVLQVASIWAAQTIRVRVVDGVVVESSAECIPAPSQMGECEEQPYEAADYTVEGLFARARAEAARSGEFTTIEFDPEYGYPTKIAYDDPNVYDEDSAWRVTSFTAEGE